MARTEAGPARASRHRSARYLCLVAGLVLATLIPVRGAAAEPDPDDANGPLDLRSVNASKDGGSGPLSVTLRTQRRWAKRVLEKGGPNRLAALFDLDLDGTTDARGRVVMLGKTLTVVLSVAGQKVLSLPVERPNRRTVVFVVPPGSPANPPGPVGIGAKSRFRSAGTCRPACRDRAPDAGWIVVKVGAKAGCTLVIGFSQTNSWFAAFESVAPGASWQLLWRSGGSINLWADPSYAGWREPIVSPCADPDAPENALLTISSSGYERDASWFVPWIEQAIETLRGKYPSVKHIFLQPVVGGPGHQSCFIGEVEVRATHNHPLIDEAIQGVAGGTVEAGASPEVPSCDGYEDGIGHLTDASADSVGRSLGSFYS